MLLTLFFSLKPLAAVQGRGIPAEHGTAGVGGVEQHVVLTRIELVSSGVRVRGGAHFFECDLTTIRICE